MAIIQLNADEVQHVGGDGIFGQVGAAFGGFAAVAGGLAMIPTPASAALGGFAVVTGVLGALFSYADSKVGS